MGVTSAQCPAPAPRLRHPRPPAGRLGGCRGDRRCVGGWRGPGAAAGGGGGGRGRRWPHRTAMAPVCGCVGV